jgi:hypothetical protein
LSTSRERCYPQYGPAAHVCLIALSDAFWNICLRH